MAYEGMSPAKLGFAGGMPSMYKGAMDELRSRDGTELRSRDGTELRSRDGTNSDEKRYRDDTVDFDNAMDEHALGLQSTLQNPDFVRGIVNNALAPPQHRKKSSNHGVRRSSTSTAASSTPRARDRHHRTASLNNGHVGSGGSTSGGPGMEAEISKLISRLASERQKTADLKQTLNQANSDLAFQTKRLETADDQLKVLKKKEEEGSARRKQMDIDFSKMKEQLKFMKTQYEAAVNEIKKAQQEIDQLDDERHKAVNEVAREKEKVRQLLEERKIRDAREEGYKEGLAMGKEEGVRMGATTARKYGVKDGKEAERRRQNEAIQNLVQDVEAGIDEPPTPIDEPAPRTAVRETYNVVDAATPGPERRGPASAGVDPSVGFGRARPVTDIPGVTIDPRTHTAALVGLPVLPASAPLPTTTNQPSYQQGRNSYDQPGRNSYDQPGRGVYDQQGRNSYDQQGRNQYDPSGNPNINILSGGQGLAEPGPGMSRSQGNRTSAPPNINTAPPSQQQNQRLWGGGVVGTGSGSTSNQGHRAPARNRSDSGGSRGGRAIVTPPTSLDRGTPLEQYDILRNPNGEQGGRRMSLGGGLREQVNEMSPIMEGNSEPARSPVGPYFQDAAMGVRPNSNQYQPHNQQQHDRPGSRTNGSHQPTPPKPGPPRDVANAPRIMQTLADPAGQRRQPPNQPTQGRRAAPPGTDGSSSEGHGRNRGPGGHSRSQSHVHAPTHSNAPAGNGKSGRHRRASTSGHPSQDYAPPPIEVRASTPPNTATDRSTKMAQAGGALMGSPAFQASAVTYGDPGHGQRRNAGPNRSPMASPQPHRSPLPQRSPLPAQRELTRDDVVPSDPSGGRYRPPSDPPHGYGQGHGVNGHGRGGSMNAMDRGPPQPEPSPRFNSNQSLAHPTPRRYADPLEMSPEVIQIHPSGTTPVGTEFDLAGNYIGGDIPKPKGKGKGKVSAEQKKRRREGFVDYDDEIPQIEGLGYAQDQEPPQTTRSRVQSMYGIRPGENPNRSPMFDVPPLPTPGNGPKRTPLYEEAPLPPPKSARMQSGNLPQRNGGYNQRDRDMPAPSPQRSTTSSQIRRAMEEDLDTPIHPYDPDKRKYVGEDHHHDHHEEDHGDPRVLNIDILEEKAEDWDTRSGRFLPRKLPPSHEDGMEVIPPPNASPSMQPVRQDASFLGTGNHPRPPPSPNTVQRGPPTAYVNPSDFDDGNIVLPPNPTFSSHHEGGRSPMMRQSLPVTASSRSSNNALPPVQPSDLPWATGKSTTSQLPRQSMYEPAPSSAGMPPNTSTTWGYVRDSVQTVAPVGPIGNDGLGFTFRSSNMPQESYRLAPASPMDQEGIHPLTIPPPGSTRANIMNVPGSTRSNIMNIQAPGSTRSNFMPIPGTNRSIVNPLPSQSQTMLERMLTPDAAAPEPDNEPIIPKKKVKKSKKK